MQKINKFNIGATLATVMLLSAPVAVYARDGNSGGGSGNSNSGSGNTSAATKTKTETETEHGVTTTSPQAETEHGAEVETHEAVGATELRHKGTDDVATLQQTQAAAVKQRSPEERQKACEARKDNLSNKFNHIVTNSQRVQTRIDGILSKAQAFQQSSGQTPADFDTLVTAAMTAQANSSASITALQAVKPTIDCTSTTVASQVATFKAAAQQTQDNLKAYKTAVKAVLKSLQTTKATTEGSN